MTDKDVQNYEQNRFLSGERLFSRKEAWVILIIGLIIGIILGVSGRI